MDQNQYRFIIMLWMFYFLCWTVQGASVPLPKITVSQTGEADNVTITAVTEMISSHTTESLHTSSVADDYVSQVSDIYNKDTQTASDINVSLISVIYSNDTHTGVSACQKMYGKFQQNRCGFVPQPNHPHHAFSHIGLEG